MRTRGGENQLTEAFKCEALTKLFGGRRVLDGLNLTVEPGETVGLLGANGAGKTTMLKVLLGLLPADGGRSSIAGEPSGNLSSEARARIGYVPQTPAQFAWLTGRAMLRYVGAFYPRFDWQYTESLIEQGSCQSLVNLSSVYDRGVGVSADHKRAADYVEQAVHCDPTDSFYLWKLAMRFFDANGRAHDCEAAEKYFVQSLDHGYADAAVDLGYIFDKGCGTIARNDTRAFQIYLLGAKLGVALCQNNVGAMIKHGRGVKEADPARGYGWIKLAVLKGDPLANKNLDDPLFTPEVRAVGLAHLADIQARLVLNSADPRAVLSDPWY